MFRLKFAWVFVFLFLISTAWAQQAAPARVKAVATFSVLGDMVKNVGGDKVDIEILVGANGDAHTFEPTPKETIALSQANVVFENGLHFEHWLDKLYQSSGSKASRVIVTDGVETIDKGNAGDVDPHVWHDVSNAMIMVERIRDGLIAADKGNAEYYHANAEKYLIELGGLDHWVIDTLKDIPDERRKLVTSHDTFGYFARRYDFTVIGMAIESATTEAADPSAADIAHLVDQIKAAGIKAVFTENMHNPKLLESIANDAGVKLAPQLYTDALGLAGSDGDTYIKMIHHNVSVIAESLK